MLLSGLNCEGLQAERTEPLIAAHCYLNIGISAVTGTVFTFSLNRGKKVRATVLVWTIKEAVCKKEAVGYGDDDFTKLKAGGYSEHLHYKGQHSGKGWRMQDAS